MAHKNSKKSDKIPLLEWIVAAFGLVLVVGTIGFMMNQAFTVKDTPPSFKANFERIDQVDSGYIVIFKVINEGEQTASGVEIEGELRRGAESVEKSNVTIDYAPSKSELKGGLFFKNNPHEFQIEINAKGYTEP